MEENDLIVEELTKFYATCDLSTLETFLRIYSDMVESTERQLLSLTARLEKNKQTIQALNQAITQKQEKVYNC